MSAVAAVTRSLGDGGRERLGLDDDQAHVVRDDVVELLGDPHALLGDRALGEQLALALEALGALLKRLEAVRAGCGTNSPMPGADRARQADGESGRRT